MSEAQLAWRRWKRAVGLAGMDRLTLDVIREAFMAGYVEGAYKAGEEPGGETQYGFI